MTRPPHVLPREGRGGDVSNEQVEIDTAKERRIQQQAVGNAKRGWGREAVGASRDARRRERLKANIREERVSDST